MTVLALAVMGLLAFFEMPVSLLPDLDIPVITVRLNYQNMDARSFEDNITAPLRRQLMQVNGLKKIESETKEGNALIKLFFNYSVKTDYAFIETNEKIDAVSALLPRDMERPVVIKSKPSDIPAFYISIIPDTVFFNNPNTFEQLSKYVENVVKRRLEQLDEVAMVDVSGTVHNRIVIEPLTMKMSILGFTNNDIISAVRNNNISVGALSFREGHFIYHLRIKPAVLTIDDLKNITLHKNKKLFKLNDITKIYIQPDNGNSLFYHNKSRSISIAVYKQPGARMREVKQHVTNVLHQLQYSAGNISFVIERDQTSLLSNSISNLKQTLIIGILLSVLVMFVFVKRIKLPLIIAVAVPLSIAVSFFFLWLGKISINIISLSGLVLSVGLMIDNAIIVIDNINQHRLAGKPVFEATVSGTNEVIRPLLSSALTTIAVFLPLVILSGIAGALFFDQAITIAISLSVSLLISITVIPTIYHLLTKNVRGFGFSSISKKTVLFYEKTETFFLRHKRATLFLFLMFVPTAYLLFTKVKKEKFPELSQNAFVMKIEWNGPISLEENLKRTNSVISAAQNLKATVSAYIGNDGFIMSNSRQSINAATLYVCFDTVVNIQKMSGILKKTLAKYGADVKVMPDQNIFQTIFNTGEPYIKVRFKPQAKKRLSNRTIKDVFRVLNSIDSIQYERVQNFEQGYEINLFPDKILIYNTDIQHVAEKLKTLFRDLDIDRLSTGNGFVKVVLKERVKNMEQIPNSVFVVNNNGKKIPLSTLLSVKKVNLLKNILSDESGEYVQITYNDNIPFEQVLKISDLVKQKVNGLETSFEGQFFDQKQIFLELLKVFVYSFLLLYLILAAQFESLLLPFIILTELFIDIAGSLFLLVLFSQSLNIMSALGIIVMSGIVINDSIIKIDTINKEYKKGKSLCRAIIEGGKRRVLPIVMTSITTVSALVPLLFYSGMGVELQAPLALSIIGGLSLGTFVSLYFVPVMFYLLKKKSQNISLT